MSRPSRVKTIQMITSGSKNLKGSPKLSAILGELNRVELAGRVKGDRAWLLAVLHTTRALDTTLSELIADKGWGTDMHSLGDYLKELDKRGVLMQGERKQYQKDVVHKRNKYMHQAGAMPQKQEADFILREMETLLTAVFARL